jgi:cytochrome c biogenesis protein CcdA
MKETAFTEAFRYIITAGQEARTEILSQEAAMSQKIFALTAGVVFLLIALGHLLRIIFDGTFVVQGISVPMWASGIAVIITGYLAYQGFRLGSKSGTGV